MQMKEILAHVFLESQNWFVAERKFGNSAASQTRSHDK